MPIFILALATTLFNAAVPEAPAKNHWASTDQTDSIQEVTAENDANSTIDKLKALPNQIFKEDMKVDQINWFIFVPLFVLLNVMLLSGFRAAALAKACKRSSTFFFLVGFFSFFCLEKPLKTQRIKQQFQQLQQDHQQALDAEDADARKQVEEAIANGFVAQVTAPDGTPMTQSYFKSIMRKDDGTPAGPWTVTYNGTTVTVLEITDAMLDGMQVRFSNLSGQEIRGRIPYSRITQWEDC